MSTPTHPLSRRAAVQWLAAGVASTALGPSLVRATSRFSDDGAVSDTAARRIQRIGLQLYTIRAALAKDLEGSITAVAASGITELEFAGYYDKPAAWWKNIMQSHGLSSPSAHIGLPKTDAEWAPHFDMSKTLGQSWVIVPFVGGEFRSADGFKRLADRLNSGGALAKAAGLRMAYHNHDFEFAALPDGGNGMTTLLKNTDPALVDFELDLYWAVKAGQDPLVLLRDHPQRFVCCHVKDAGPAPDRAMMEVGRGTIDFKTILATGRKVGLKHWFIEHDAPKEPLASIAVSAAALKRI